MNFRSDLKFCKALPKELTDVKISRLPQLYRASMEFAEAQNNPELNALLKQFNITGEFKYISIDSRSHMLMTGMYPCIPGWHCDDFYRIQELGGQPDLQNVHEVAPAIHHLLVLGDNSRTEFLANDIELPSTELVQAEHGKDAPVYLHYDKMILDGNEKSRLVEPGKIYTFGPTAFHRGSAATHNGWRYFIRITESNHREPKNEIRYQTQVYTDSRVSW